MNNQERQALIERLNILAEKLKWHNVNYAQDVCLAVKEITALEAPQPEPYMWELWKFDETVPELNRWFLVQRSHEKQIALKGQRVVELYTAPPAPVLNNIPDGWVACSPEWIERNGPCSCANAPRIAFGNTGSHYHPYSFTAASVMQPVNFSNVEYASLHDGFYLKRDDVISAIRAAGYPVEE